MNLIQFLAMKLHQGPVFIDDMVNSTEVVVHPKTNFVKVEGVARETIDGARQLILQDSHVTYRGIETTLGISGTSIHSILHEHLIVTKICLRWIPHNLPIAHKNQSIRVAKVLRQLVQTPAKVYRS